MKTIGRDAELQGAADYYLQQLRAGDFDSAFHGLIDLDPDIVHPLIAAYHAEAVPGVRSALLRIIWEFRTPLALPLLADVLRDRRDTRWRLALDGLVTLASPEAIRILETALRDETSAANPDSDYMAWVREALEQAQDAHAANSHANAKESLLEVLREARSWLARPDNDFAWSTWDSASEALAELDGFISHLEAGRSFDGSKLSILFAPTADIQEVSVSSGWGDEFCRLAERFASAFARYESTGNASP